MLDGTDAYDTITPICLNILLLPRGEIYCNYATGGGSTHLLLSIEKFADSYSSKILSTRTVPKLKDPYIFFDEPHAG